MKNPGAYDSSPEELIRRAARRTNLGVALLIDTSLQKIEGHHNDGILVLPEVPYLTRNQPVPAERKPTGKFTPLDNVKTPQAIQAARSVISHEG